MTMNQPTAGRPFNTLAGKVRRAAMFPALMLLIASCSSADPDEGSTAPLAEPAATTSAAPAETTTATATQDWDATELANALVEEVPTAASVTTVTEDNDENGLIGRPGGYVSAAWIQDETLPASTGTAGGATVEVFASEDDATRRSEYILGLLKDSPMLGTEWHHQSGEVLLRVTGEMKPSDAEAYGAAFAKLAG